MIPGVKENVHLASLSSLVKSIISFELSMMTNCNEMELN